MVKQVGKVITFYSYKGGTGRSMMLANIAWLLASNGDRVLVIDWDLEAPGLHRYFKPFLIDPDMTETDGLIDAFWELVSFALTNESPNERSTPLDDRSFINLGVDLEDYINPLKWKFHGNGGIDFIGAGLQNATYSERVNTFDWKRFYQLGGGRLLTRTRNSLINQYEYVLIDSRTGVSDSSGICTIQMPDVLVACLTLNRQSIEGVASILESIRTWRNKSQLNPQKGDDRREIKFYPVATRIENSEKAKLDMARARVREVFKPFLSQADSQDLRQYWDDMEVTYRPYYAYEEVLAAFGDTAGAAGSAKTLLSEMEAVGRRICSRLDLVTPEIPENDRQNVLAQYAFVTPPTRRPDNLINHSDTDFLRKIYAKEVLWRQSDFYYRFLLSPGELRQITPEMHKNFGRQMSFFHTNSETFAAFRGRTNFIFWFIFAGCALLLLILYSQLLVVIVPENAVLKRLLEISSRFLVFFPAFGGIYLAFVATQLYAAFRSPKKPHGVRLQDVFKFSLLGPASSEIKDFREANEWHESRT
jgi:cellulose biosynthesis protein BcsQ